MWQNVVVAILDTLQWLDPQKKLVFDLKIEPASSHIRMGVNHSTELFATR